MTRHSVSGLPLARVGKLHHPEVNHFKLGVREQASFRSRSTSQVQFVLETVLGLFGGLTGILTTNVEDPHSTI